MSEPAVLVERDGHVVTVTLNRPHKKNAFDAEVLCRLCDAWDLIDGDDDVRVGILTGAGLLVVCELKAARRYRVTANALDAAGIAILFATIFASHSLWGLLGATAAFLLMALVAAVAVGLAIRRDSRASRSCPSP